MAFLLDLLGVTFSLGSLRRRLIDAAAEGAVEADFRSGGDAKAGGEPCAEAALDGDTTAATPGPSLVTTVEEALGVDGDANWTVVAGWDDTLTAGAPSVSEGGLKHSAKEAPPGPSEDATDGIAEGDAAESAGEVMQKRQREERREEKTALEGRGQRRR